MIPLCFYAGFSLLLEVVRHAPTPSRSDACPFPIGSENLRVRRSKSQSGQQQAAWAADGWRLFRCRRRSTNVDRSVGSPDTFSEDRAWQIKLSCPPSVTRNSTGTFLASTVHCAEVVCSQQKVRDRLEGCRFRANAKGDAGHEVENCERRRGRREARGD